MSTDPPFGTQLIGQTEKALNAILDRELTGTGLTEPQWVTLTIAVMSGGTVDSAALANRVAGALKVSDAQARVRIDELAASGLLEANTDQAVSVTETGSRLQARIRATVTEITQRLWGDLPPDDLRAAGRVLTTVLDRANAELFRANENQSRR
jgi:DNA-binding MarR family transcriptional regulator